MKGACAACVKSLVKGRAACVGACGRVRASARKCGQRIEGK